MFSVSQRGHAKSFKGLPVRPATDRPAKLAARNSPPRGEPLIRFFPNEHNAFLQPSFPFTIANKCTFNGLHLDYIYIDSRGHLDAFPLKFPRKKNPYKINQKIIFYLKKKKKKEFTPERERLKLETGRK